MGSIKTVHFHPWFAIKIELDVEHLQHALQAISKTGESENGTKTGNYILT